MDERLSVRLTAHDESEGVGCGTDAGVREAGAVVERRADICAARGAEWSKPGLLPRRATFHGGKIAQPRTDTRPINDKGF